MSVVCLRVWGSIPEETGPQQAVTHNPIHRVRSDCAECEGRASPEAEARSYHLEGEEGKRTPGGLSRVSTPKHPPSAVRWGVPRKDSSRGQQRCGVFHSDGVCLIDG